jgi:hypothetical protein
MKKIIFLVVLGMMGLIFISGCTEQTTVFSLKNISTDKVVYHSSDIMNLSVVIYSDSYLENVTVKADGVNGRFNAEKVLNLKKGSNEVSFAYTLPRCNVCGGISAGDYSLSCSVSYKNTTVIDSKMINIQQ